MVINLLVANFQENNQKPSIDFHESFEN